MLRESKTHDDIRLLALLRSAAAADGHQGSFVEIGAYDGINSQTWVLEKCYGWSGVLIEANPEHYHGLLLAANRSAATQRVHSAVCKPPRGHETGKLEMRLAGGTISSAVGLGQAHDKRYGVHFRRNGTTAMVPCAALPSIISAAGFGSGATYLSLDVEGAEEHVLKTVPLTAFPFSVVLVEADGLDKLKDFRVDSMLREAGLQQHKHPVVPHSINHLFSKRMWNFTYDAGEQAALAARLELMELPQRLLVEYGQVDLELKGGENSAIPRLVP